MIRPIIRDLIKNRFYSKEYTSNLPIVSIPPYSNSLINSEYNNTTGCTPVNSTISAINGVLTNTGNGSGVTPSYTQDSSIVCATNKKIYVRYLARVTNSSSTQICFHVFGSIAGALYVNGNVANPIGNNWYVISQIVTLTAEFTGNVIIQVVHGYADNAISNNKAMEVTQPIVLDYTALEETETDLSYLSMKYPFNANALGGNLQLKCMGVDGGSSEQDVDIVGKNLLPKLSPATYTIKGITVTVNVDGSIKLNGTATDSINIPLQPDGTFILDAGTYIFNLTGVFNPNIYLVTGDVGSELSYASGGFRTFTLTNRGTIGYCLIQIPTGSTLNNYIVYPQIERGSIANAYEPYNATRLHVQQLNGVGSIKDELYLTDWKLPNISEPIKAGTGTRRAWQNVLQASDVASMYTGETGIDYAFVNKPTDFIGYGSQSYTGVATLESHTEFTGSITDVSNIGKFSTRNQPNTFVIGFAKGTTLAQAQTALAGKKLCYVLATPQPINIEPWTYGLIGDLKYRQGGSIVYSATPPQTTLQFETPY